MKDQLVNEILSRLDSLGNTISNGAQKGYEIYVRQEFWNGVTGLISEFLLACAVVIPTIIAFKLFNKDQKQFINEVTPRGLLIIGLGFMSVVFTFGFLFGLSNLPSNIMKIINPNYYAIKDILSAIKH
jgi:hypothetical protein